ncbi:glutathione synthase [Devosia sp. J2-20]|jgi:glutathione synthase|uniref:glutathione synthase n=1 Tax=Devosia TaxID=46913 RepID=UPI0022AF1EA7|nr:MULTISPECIES: glutathione synthase [Devosia]MCZ4347460.1 glutathione synthase [Devosia neptuniae]WDR00165.1 glutathione synthase [Devosia sp. J2-20]|tara:strand:+ start:52473 stop:53420 length:948 start_codon:yes stop_codon:yes gene_type:complete
MTLKVAVQMDHVATINPTGDSTFAMMLEAQARGHKLLHYTPDTLALRDNVVTALAASIEVFDRPKGEHFQLGEETRVDLSTQDVIHMRQDPPFDMNYITITHLLERLHPKTLVVNPPAAVRNAPEKILVTDFPELMPPTLVTRDRAMIHQFRREHTNIIVKPLYGNGGAGVFFLQEGDHNLASLLELFEANYREPFMIQKYLPDVRKGDKRIIIIDGEPVAGLNRIPADGEARSNMHVGGRPELSELTAREREICAAIAPALKERDMIFVGIDVIGDYLTEINVTSPTGIREIKRFGGPDIAVMIWDAIEKRRAS